MSVAPPVPRLPSLNALRAFEASARLGGFSQAAQELNVLPGAVAALVKKLEEDIGAPLFERRARGVRLTPLGERALPGFVAVFDSLGQTVRDLRREAAPRKVHIAALPALAELWLAPRLPAVRAKHPDMDISVTALEVPPNLKRVPFDLCLFYADAADRGATVISSDELLPVCTPEIAATLKSPMDLDKVTCLTDSAWSDDWRIWASRSVNGWEFVPKGPIYSLYSLAVQEALSGAGVLMAHKSLIEEHLRSGDLVAPFAMSVRLERPMSLWSLPGGRGNKAVDDVTLELKRLATLND
ncbi:Glycine cleavage system transcriptional activator [Labrenzia sp. THAF82]|uniref:LysR family transcriptional regulator n=1 Tax=Labrenzia sp. THAF82 TaxID=2587861 RepID=UPI001268E772|nr:LysR family transcriptional regulator [Labrenzia sp. THAF82]QFT33407.1 Glycine cleavage system transcriptional activator [Labrenzia sp. THAF82]